MRQLLVSLLAIAIVVLPLVHAAETAHASHDTGTIHAADHSNHHLPTGEIAASAHAEHGCAAAEDAGAAIPPDRGAAPDCGVYPICHIVILPPVPDAALARTHGVFEAVSARALLAHDAQPPLTPPRA